MVTIDVAEIKSKEQREGSNPINPSLIIIAIPKEEDIVITEIVPKVAGIVQIKEKRSHS